LDEPAAGSSAGRGLFNVLRSERDGRTGEIGSSLAQGECLGLGREGMMMRCAPFVAGVAVFWLAIASHAAADPVTITDGSIVFSEPSLFQVGSMSITGTRGFSVNGSVDSGESSVGPLRSCFPCEPTPNFSVDLGLGTFSIFRGVATLDGKTYSDLNGLNSVNTVLLQLVGSTELPPVNAGSIVIRAPFTVAAGSEFQFEVAPESNGQPPVIGIVPLRGRGVATVNFDANSSVPVWEFSSARYDFQPTPEPATLLLVGGALLLLRAERRAARAS